jgi:hypothetical protein
MSTAKGSLTAVSYCIGIVMTLVCVALVLAGNTELVWRFEHRGFPLSWVFGCVAIAAFLVCEYCQSASPRPRAVATDDEMSFSAYSWESAESVSE